MESSTHKYSSTHDTPNHGPAHNACIRAGHKEVIPVRSVVGDVRKLTELRIATRDVTTVIHTAGVVSFGTFPDVKAMNDVNAKGLCTFCLSSVSK